MQPFEPNPLDQRILDHVGEFPRDLFTDLLYQANEAMEDYALRWALALVRELGLEALLATPQPVAALVEERAFRPAIAPALGSLLERLAEEGILTARRDGGEQVFHLHQALPEPDLEGTRARITDLIPALEPALELADAAGSAHLPIARGETTGRDAILGAGQAGLWCRYFDNGNPGYLLNNRLAALAAANRLPEMGGFSVLEIGGGAGSATEALLDELDQRGRSADLGFLRFTEPSPFFRRRASRLVSGRLPGDTLSLGDLDMNQPWADQGVPEASLDMVFAVNVLHVAQNLAFTLKEALRSLRPGGWLVAGEAIRPFSSSSLQAEMVFCLLEDFVQVEIDPEVRPRFGFLTPEEWEQAFSACGFENARVLPDIKRIRLIYPRFFSGVVCGRSPSQNRKEPLHGAKSGS